MNKLGTFAALVLLSAALFAGCHHDATAHHDTMKALPAMPNEAIAIPSAEGSDKPVHAAVLVDNPHAKVAVVTIQPGGGMPPHAAPVPVTVKTLSGTGSLELDGKSHPLDTDHFITMAANAKHAVKAGDDAPLVLLVHYLRGGAAPAAAKDDHHGH